MNNELRVPVSTKLGRWALRLWLRHFVRLDRPATREHVLAMGSLTPAYVFLVIASCSIATLGLLLDSVAVIIGAMLIAPLMGPIILFGFAIASTDIRQGTTAAKALLIGVLTALGTSYAIVKLAPFIAPTAQILARVQPNLFDLVVAVLSGLVGGYAVIRREVGTVAGVAIATALMPPLATAGYGLATGNMPVFEGAFFLFLTNMVAIALSVSGVAIWYGFGNLHAPRELLWKTFVGLLVIGLLSIPLVRSLNQTVTRAYTVKQIEGVLRSEEGHHGWQLGQMSTREVENGALHVAALVFVRKVDEDASERLQTRLQAELGRRVELELNQVTFADRLPVTAPPPVMTPAAPVELTEAEALRRYLKRYLSLPSTAVELDEQARTVAVQVAPVHDWRLSDLQTQERTLAKALPSWQVRLIPPVTPLPVLTFVPGTAELDGPSQRAWDDILWALQRWQAPEVALRQLATAQEARKQRALLKARSQALVSSLEAQGIRCHTAKPQVGKTPQISLTLGNGVPASAKGSS